MVSADSWDRRIASGRDAFRSDPITNELERSFDTHRSYPGSSPGGNPASAKPADARGPPRDRDQAEPCASQSASECSETGLVRVSRRECTDFSVIKYKNWEPWMPAG